MTQYFCDYLSLRDLPPDQALKIGGKVHEGSIQLIGSKGESTPYLEAVLGHWLTVMPSRNDLDSAGIALALKLRAYKEALSSKLQSVQNGFEFGYIVFVLAQDWDKSSNQELQDLVAADRTKAQLDQMIALCRQALDAVNERQFSDGRAGCCQIHEALGLLLQQIDDIESASDYFLQALTEVDALPVEFREQTELSIGHELMLVDVELGKAEKAASYIEELLDRVRLVIDGNSQQKEVPKAILSNLTVGMNWWCRICLEPGKILSRVSTPTESLRYLSICRRANDAAKALLELRDGDKWRDSAHGKTTLRMDQLLIDRGY